MFKILANRFSVQIYKNLDYKKKNGRRGAAILNLGNSELLPARVLNHVGVLFHHGCREREVLMLSLLESALPVGVNSLMGVYDVEAAVSLSLMLPDNLLT